MSHQLKNIIVTICFIAVLSGLMLTNIAAADAELSRSERSLLAQLPDFTFEKLINGELFTELDEYFSDQFVGRDFFRSIKALSVYNLFRMKDNNNFYIVNGSIIKMEYRLNEKSVINAAAKINEIYEKYLQGKQVSYAVIPDKNYFTACENGYLSFDYQRMQELLEKNIKNMQYISLFDLLTIDDYYATDIHWRQERIMDVADELLKKMGINITTSEKLYTEIKLYPFYGSYYGQAAVRLEPDTLVYLSDAMLEKARVYDYENKTTGSVYVPERFEGMDPYDVFLSGARALLTVTNPDSTSDKELILFRDSFGSSIAPLLLTGYAKITLVDLRYITTDLLGEYIDFTKDQDVLFLYNTQVLNNSYMLK